MKILFIISILLIGCTTKKIERYVCTCEQRERVSQFVSLNIKNANNMSDEEMEDVIQKLYWTAVKLNCEIKVMECESITPFLPVTKLDSCQFIMEYQ